MRADARNRPNAVVQVREECIFSIPRGWPFRFRPRTRPLGSCPLRPRGASRFRPAGRAVRRRPSPQVRSRLRGGTGKGLAGGPGLRTTRIVPKRRPAFLRRGFCPRHLGHPNDAIGRWVTARDHLQSQCRCGQIGWDERETRVDIPGCYSVKPFHSRRVIYGSPRSARMSSSTVVGV